MRIFDLSRGSPDRGCGREYERWPARDLWCGCPLADGRFSHELDECGPPGVRDERARRAPAAAVCSSGVEAGVGQPGERSRRSRRPRRRRALPCGTIGSSAKRRWICVPSRWTHAATSVQRAAAARPRSKPSSAQKSQLGRHVSAARSSSGDVLEGHGSRRARRSQSIWFCLRMMMCSIRCSSASERASWPECGMTACRASVTSSSVAIRWSSALAGVRVPLELADLRRRVAAERGDLLDERGACPRARAARSPTACPPRPGPRGRTSSPTPA